MEKSDIENYINRLKELDKKINKDDISNDFAVELNQVLHSLNKDIETELGRKVQNPPTMDVNFKKLHPDAITPTYAKDGDAGLDLTIISVISNTLFQVIYGTGLAFEVPRGYVGLVFPRSSVRDYKLTLANCVGVLDSGFRGEIVLTFNKTNSLNPVLFQNHPEYEIGDKAAQLIIIPFPTINLIEKKELSTTERNDGGHGHTGK